MRPHLTRTRAGLVVIAVVTAVVVAACGSSKSGATSSPSSSSGSGANVAAAQADIAPYTGQASPFPATEKLASLPKPGSKFVFLQCTSPVCAIFALLYPAATKELGVSFQAINSGASATSSQAAASSALAEKPAAVLVGASNPQLYGNYLHQLASAGSVVAGGGTVGGEQYGVQQSVGGDVGDVLAGKLMADWVTVNKGPKANVTFFGTPELSFSPVMESSFDKTLAQNCPGCKVSSQKVSVTTFGTTAPSQVVSYLQSHPAVNTVVFASMEAATGLAAALRNAQLSPTTLGFAPSPSNLQDIQQGGLTAGLALDFNVQIWLQVNLAARLIAHQKTPQSNLNTDLRFLTKSDLAGMDVSRGYTGYPDVAQRMAKLWGVNG